MILLALGFYVSFLAVLTLLVVLGVAVWQGSAAGDSHKTPLQTITIEEPQSASIDDQIAFWEAQLEKQPTSRDILLNLSMLHQSKNNGDLAKEYKEKAELIDPNYENEEKNK